MAGKQQLHETKLSQACPHLKELSERAILGHGRMLELSLIIATRVKRKIWQDFASPNARMDTSLRVPRAPLTVLQDSQIGQDMHATNPIGIVQVVTL